jgi:hypothetical protein
MLCPRPATRPFLRKMQNIYWHMLPYDDLSGGCYKETDYVVCAAVTVLAKLKCW